MPINSLSDGPPDLAGAGLACAGVGDGTPPVTGLDRLDLTSDNRLAAALFVIWLNNMLSSAVYPGFLYGTFFLPVDASDPGMKGDFLDFLKLEIGLLMILVMLYHTISTSTMW